MKQVQLGSVGTSLELLVTDEDGIVDLSTASLLQIILEKPDGAALTKSAVVVTNGLDGLMHYVTLNGDLDQIGVWKIQGRISFPGTDFHTIINLFRVYENL